VALSGTGCTSIPTLARIAAFDEVAPAGMVRKSSPEIAGATLVTAHAGEMISELTLAIANNLTMQALAETVHCYPTQAEVFQRMALSYKPAKMTA
jgi:pyruvate/2-oxoglutarate dehydrogenase complex dihydrolipoamide dehydrogenase (E3) component